MMILKNLRTIIKSGSLVRNKDRVVTPNKNKKILLLRFVAKKAWDLFKSVGSHIFENEPLGSNSDLWIHGHAFLEMIGSPACTQRNYGFLFCFVLRHLKRKYGVEQDAQTVMMNLKNLRTTSIKNRILVRNNIVVRQEYGVRMQSDKLYLHPKV